MTKSNYTEMLAGLVERIERLEEEKAGIASDIREVYSEVKACGFNVPVVREIVRLRKQDKHERDEKEQLLDEYKHALGMDG